MESECQKFQASQMCAQEAIGRRDTWCPGPWLSRTQDLDLSCKAPSPPKPSSTTHSHTPPHWLHMHF